MVQGRHSVTKRKPTKQSTGRNTPIKPSQTGAHEQVKQTAPRKGVAPSTGRDPRRIAVLVIVALVVIMAIVGIVFSMRGCTADKIDDSQAIQGEWSVDGHDMTVVFTDRQIKLPGGTTYDYSIDVKAGTMTFGVGNVTGNGTYTIGKNKDGSLTLAVTEVLDGTETVTSYTKLSDNIQAVPTVSSTAPEISTTTPEQTPQDESGVEGDTTTTDEGDQAATDETAANEEDTPDKPEEENTAANVE